MGFECNHCGECCDNPAIQINISIADIIRIAKFLNLDIKDIMPKFGIKAFPDPKNKNKFDYDIGLNKPCKFRKHNRCSIYPARPLNCRIFPYFILAKIKKENIRTVIDCSHKCSFDYNEEDRQKYRDYTEFIGNLILEEAKITEQFLEQNNLNQSKVLVGINFPKAETIEQEKKIMQEKIKLAEQTMDKISGLDKNILNFIKNTEKITSSEEINEKENKILKRQHY